MSWGTCFSGSNNIHHSYPPMMSDGRNFSTWTSPAVVDDHIKQNLNIQSNLEYRHYLQKNAASILKNNKFNACKQCSNLILPEVCNETNTPYLYRSCKDKSTPFGYENSDLKNMYLSRNNLLSRINVPIKTQQQYLNYQRAN